MLFCTAYAIFWQLPSQQTEKIFLTTSLARKGLAIVSSAGRWKINYACTVQMMFTGVGRSLRIVTSFNAKLGAFFSAYVLVLRPALHFTASISSTKSKTRTYWKVWTSHQALRDLHFFPDCKWTLPAAWESQPLLLLVFWLGIKFWRKYLVAGFWYRILAYALGHDSFWQVPLSSFSVISPMIPWFNHSASPSNARVPYLDESDFFFDAQQEVSSHFNSSALAIGYQTFSLPNQLLLI